MSMHSTVQSAGAEGNRYSFVTEYFDPQANMVRQYMLLFYTFDNSIEMYDIKNKRMFLKRVKYQQLTAKELFVGASVTVYSRVLKLVDFGDEVTRRQFSKNEEAFVFLPSPIMAEIGSLLQFAHANDMRVINLRMADATPKIQALAGISQRFIGVHLGGSDIPPKATAITTAFKGSRVLQDQVEITSACRECFTSLTTATCANCSVCVVKPHAIGSGHGGEILRRIFDEGFEVTALGAFTLSSADAEDFLEVYKGVVPEYRKLVDQMSSAACWAVEVRSENAVAALRSVCGPHDPEVCHILFPHTIRSQFGEDRCRNAVHCTDLPEDGPLESEFFFDLMLNKP